MYEEFNKNFQYGGMPQNNNNFQNPADFQSVQNMRNTVMPNGLNGMNPYNDQYFGEYDRTPYIQALNPPLPGMLPGSGSMKSSPYPLQASLATPTLSAPVNYAKGGNVRGLKTGGGVNSANPYSTMGEILREQGQNGDTMLAHINPIEAMILKQLGGSGTTNPVTGLPQFDFWSKAKKTVGRALGGVGGAVIGNMLLPGIGGLIGGELGGGAQSVIRGKNPWIGALKGVGIGGMMPSVAGLLGSGASALGMGGLGSALTGYGNRNAILPALGLGGGGGGGGLSSLWGGGENAAASAATGPKALGADGITRLLAKAPAISATGGIPGNLGTLGTIKAAAAESPGFMDMLLSKSKDFFSDPGNLLATGLAASQVLGQKTPVQEAKERAKAEKAYQNAMKKSEAEQIADARTARSVELNKFLPREELGNLEDLAMYRKDNTPEEQKKTGRWFEYYTNPSLQGKALPYKKGGQVEVIREKARKSPRGMGYFLGGDTGGKDDKIPALLSDGEYIIPAQRVATLGGGNNRSGAKKLDHWLNKGGSIKLPTKAHFEPKYGAK